MRRTAAVAGLAWVALAAALGAWLGIREMFGASGLIFREGYGEVYLVALLAAPGYLLHQWGKRAK